MKGCGRGARTHTNDMLKLGQLEATIAGHVQTCLDLPRHAAQTVVVFRTYRCFLTMCECVCSSRELWLILYKSSRETNEMKEIINNVIQ